MAQKPSVPKGTRDFLPADVYRRQHIIDTLRTAFQGYGYQPIETPSFENIETLMGKYGEEGDRLIFKILNNGDFLEDFRKDGQSPLDLNPAAAALKVSKKALRYDLTVPFARFVVQHQNEITFPFKRYQIQPVWRADRPQKGRFQEFYQCDADVVGSRSLWQEVELAQLYDSVFHALGLRVRIRLNHRKVLSGLAEVMGQEDKLIDFTVALDKLDKIGAQGVENEWRERGIREAGIALMRPLLSQQSAEEKLAAIREILKDSENGKQGLAELDFVMQQCRNTGWKGAELLVDITLARGLNYYTGCIFEVESSEVEMGSIGGGGRYDDLTGIFGMPGLSGVGISFGLDRIYLVLEELQRFPELKGAKTAVLFMNMGENEAAYSMRLVYQLREAGIAAELYPDAAKFKKQFQYAESLDIPFVVICGESEIAGGNLTLKELSSGEQNTISFEQLIEKLR